MQTRRMLLAAIILTLTSGTVAAQDWRQRFPDVVFSVVPSENASGVTDRYGPFIQYLSEALRVRVSLRIATDYAAVIEGMRTGQVHIAHLGPAAYARAAVVTSGAIEPFVTGRNSEGAIGYYSVLYVRANAPFQSIQELRGRNLCLVDPNSASGNNVPRFAMHKMGMVPEDFFGRIVYAGSHENAITALQQGTCDAAFNWWNTERESNLQRMATKGMIRAEDFRIVFRSDFIPGSPTSMLRDLPADMKRDIRQAFLDAPTRGREAWLRISDGNATGYAEVAPQDYQVMIELVQFVDSLRRQQRRNM
jgi:phosphonate transport system substrate-binding protein